MAVDHFTRVQSGSTDADDPTVTFGATPTEGNLLVVSAMERAGSSEAGFTISGTGWIKRIARDTLLGDAFARRTLIVWTKVAGAAEPTGITVTGPGANIIRIQTQELEAQDAANARLNVTWTFEAKADNDSGTGSTSPLSSGTTASIGAGDLLLIAVGGWRNGNAAPGSIAWMNGIGTLRNDAGGTFENTISTGFALHTAGGTKESSVSWTGTDHEATAGILVFRASAGVQ